MAGSQQGDDDAGNEHHEAGELAGADAPRWITKKQTARYLGKSERTIQRLIAARAFTAHGTGAGMRLDRVEVNAYMKSPTSVAQPSRPVATDDATATAASVHGSTPTRAELQSLGRQAHAAGIRRIFKSRVLDAAYNHEFTAALDTVEAGGEVKMMSNSLRFLLGPLPDRTLFMPMWDALRRGVYFKLLLLDPFSDAARKRSEVEERTSFAVDDDRYYDTHLYRDIIAVTRTLSEPDVDFVRDERLRQRIKSRTQVHVRFSRSEPTTHLVLTDEHCFVESYHTGGNLRIEDNLMKMGIPKLHCFGGFIMACMLTASCPSGELLASHFEHSWHEAADGLTVEDVLERDRKMQSKRAGARRRMA